MNITGFSPHALEAMMDSLPYDVSFVDNEDTVKYFNTPSSGRIFPRTKQDLGRKVQKCHPPKSLHMVESIIKAFRNGEKSDASFWINLNGRLILIRYFAVRDPDKKYLGTLEITQDITDIKKIEGERRLLEWT